jgi:transcriptional regulator with XRE-family HTH domain
MPTPAPAFAAVAATLAGIDPADTGGVSQFFGGALAAYAPRAQALVADFLIGRSDVPSADELQALKAAVSRPPADLPPLTLPGQSARSNRKPAAATPPAAPGRLDAHIAARVRSRRQALGMSEQQLAALLSLPLEQVQAYEQGSAVLTVSRLYDIALAMSVPVGFFYQGFPGADTATTFGEPTGRVRHLSEAPSPWSNPPPSPDDEHSEVLRVYDTVTDPAARRRALALISGLAAAP